MEIVSKSGLARYLGLSRTTIDAWCRRGCPHEEVAGKFVFDSEEVEAWREEQKRRAGSQPDDPAYLRERTRLTKAQADLRELELERRSGDVIDAADAMALWGEIITTFRNRLLALPRKAAPVVIGCASIIEVQELLEAEVSAILQELSSPDLRGLAVKAGMAPPARVKRTGKKKSRRK